MTATIILVFIGGALCGFAIAYSIKKFKSRSAMEIAKELMAENEARYKENIDNVIETVKLNFGDLSTKALSKSTDEFLKLAKIKLDSQKELNEEALDGKKRLIDKQLENISSEIGKVSTLMNDLEKDRKEKFGELSVQLKHTNEQTASLAITTKNLREALANVKARGQWGERMAVDILNIAGFVENVNYLKQKKIGEVGTIPDFTFLLPKELKLNMDVKFPLSNYMLYLETESDLEKKTYKDRFLKDVRKKLKEVTTRDYIDPAQNTVDYVLLFIPNEQIFAFLHEQDGALLDEGIKNKVIFCSPVTLFAVLAVIRQAVDNFALEQTSGKILSLMGTFKKQWGLYLNKLEVVGKRICDAQKEFDSLVTTRQRMLEKPLNDIEVLRVQNELPPTDDINNNK